MQTATTIINQDRFAIGRCIRSARKSLGINGRRLSRNLGISYSEYKRYEKGEKAIPRTVLLELFLFGISRWTMEK